MKQYASNQLKISDYQYFLVSIDYSSSDLHFVFLTLGITSPTWSNKISCATCSLIGGDSLKDPNNDKIYSFYTYGSPTYLQFSILNSTNGNVIGSRYISNIICDQVWSKMSTISNILAVGVSCSMYKLVLYSIVNDSFTIKDFSGNYLFCTMSDKLSNRFIMVGQMNVKGYVTKVNSDFISFHPDFSTSSMVMNLQSTGSYQIVSYSGISISTATSESVRSLNSFSNQTISFQSSIADNYSNDICVQLNTLSYLNLVENNSYKIILNLPCSSSGSTSILYSTSIYNDILIPSWITFDSLTEELTMLTPYLSSTSETFQFYVNSSVSGVKNPLQTLIILQVNKCSVYNCKICNSTDASICLVYNANTNTSNSETKTLEASKSAEIAEVGINVFVGSAGFIIIAAHLVGISSLSNLWSMINQQQIMFYLILTNIYFSDDILKVIIGSKYAFDIFEQIPIKRIQGSNIILNEFDSTQVNEGLNKIGIESGSSLVNLYSTLSFLAVTILFHFCIKFLHKCFNNSDQNQDKGCFSKSVDKILEVSLKFLTYGYYIRLFLEMNQFILLSTVSEISLFNTKSPSLIFSVVFAFLIIFFMTTIIVYIIKLVGISLFLTGGVASQKFVEGSIPIFPNFINSNSYCSNPYFPSQFTGGRRGRDN